VTTRVLSTDQLFVAGRSASHVSLTVSD